MVTPPLVGKKMQALKGEVTFSWPKLDWTTIFSFSRQPGSNVATSVRNSWATREAPSPSWLSGAPPFLGAHAGPVQSYLPRAEVTLQPRQDPPAVLAPGCGMTRPRGHTDKDRSSTVTEHAKQLGERVGCSHGDARSSKAGAHRGPACTLGQKPESGFSDLPSGPLANPPASSGPPARQKFQK